MLKIGEQVFVPRYGAGIVTAKEENELYGIKYKYIVINLVINDMKYYIPENRLEQYNIRKVSDKEIINQALAVIEKSNGRIEENWSKRYRKNKSKMLSGDTIKIAEVIRDLNQMKNEELMPHGEEKILEEAENMLASEIMLVFAFDLNTAYDLLKKY